MKKIVFLTVLFSFVSICYTNALAQNSTSCCDRKGVRAEEAKACNKDTKTCNKDTKTCSKDTKACNKDTKTCGKDTKACNKDTKSCCSNKNKNTKTLQSCCNDKCVKIKDGQTCCEKPHCIYCFKVKDIEGNVVSMKEYRGKVLLIVNVASKCGLTPQYEGLEKLYKKYKDKGLEILAFPCNQFLGQEPGTNEEIKKFCSGTYDVTFPMFDKIDVNGQNESPLYTFLKKSAPFKGYPKGAEEFGKQLEQIHQKTGTNFDKGDAIKWNFGKFLVSKDGKTIKRFEPMVEPKDLEKEIERMLK